MTFLFLNYGMLTTYLYFLTEMKHLFSGHDSGKANVIIIDTKSHLDTLCTSDLKIMNK